MPPDAHRPPPTPLQAKIPNALTILRLFLAAAFFALLEIGLGDRPATWRLGDGIPNPNPALPRDVLLAAAALFVVAAATDALDGYLARKWNAISKFGRVMDPFADKILVLGAFVYLASPAFAAVDPYSSDQARLVQLSGVAPWMAVVILARELLVTSVRGFFESQGVDFSADVAGKAKMILQSLVIPLVLVLLALNDVPLASPAWWAIHLAVWLTVLVTVLSCAPYIAKGVRSGRGLIHKP
ncbi:MAG: CDP-alcohol phosphatidyltransferase family protein [Phycisphaerales bacterium]